MAAETVKDKSRRCGQIIDALKKTYPDAHCELNFTNPLELLIATILSAQCNDKQVNIVTEPLFRKYRTAADYAAADPETFASEIKRIGLYRNKAKNIQACCQRLLDLHQGEVPRAMEELTALGGVGRKTANVVLGNAFQINQGIVVDTHVGRLAVRLGLTSQTHPEKVEKDLVRLVPQPDWTLFSHLIIWHGRRCCMARNPRCEDCELAALCPRKGLGKTKA